VYSPDRWCLTGDAGVFLDPLFSPGSDFIGTSNSLITSLILADLAGEPVADKVELVNDYYLRYFDAWLSHYRDLYPLFDNVLLTTVRFGWYALVYFGIFVPLFYENRTADLDFLAEVQDELDRVLELIPRVAGLVNDWGKLENPKVPTLHVRPITPDKGGLHDEFLSTSQSESTPRLGADEVKAHIVKNRRMLEAAAVVYFDEAVGQLPGESLEPGARINPYAISLDPERWDEDGVFDETGMTVAEADAATAGLRDVLDALRFGRVPSGPPPRPVPST